MNLFVTSINHCSSFFDQNRKLFLKKNVNKTHANACDDFFGPAQREKKDFFVLNSYAQLQNTHTQLHKHIHTTSKHTHILSAHLNEHMYNSKSEPMVIFIKEQTRFWDKKTTSS